METLLSKEETAKLYKKGGKTEVRTLLEKMHKKEDLIVPPSPLTEWEGIAKHYKMHPVNALPYPKPKNAREERMNVQFIMDVMVEYFNIDPVTKKVWEPKPGDWGYRVWYDYKAGVGFVFSASDFVYGLSFLGSRLHFKDGATANLAAKALQELQNRLFKTSK